MKESSNNQVLIYTQDGVKPYTAGEPLELCDLVTITEGIARKVDPQSGVEFTGIVVDDSLLLAKCAESRAGDFC